MSNKLKIFLTFTLIFLTSCATGGFRPDVVPRDAAGKVQIVQSGTIVSVKEITIEGDRDAGTASGAVIGAIVTGSAAKRSADGDGETSELIGGLVGGLVGSVVGSEVGEALSRKKALELIILLEKNGKEISVTQEISEDLNYNFRKGDEVRIIRSAGRVRVIPIE
ncbi:hypothetical protein M9B40_03485 [SAR86 cluster bacterium]|jgi:outer membrane lipoprotein SlyB|uniref:Glycine zipper 2TM domain-containing protein n=1 Tax=SAR86 cluster bacterium TaxID=2030880 RepID=A0A9Q8TXJ0_9GAMM|nr:hypothetical protein M9B40_03485 [SAR86 cluster bacterium]